MIRKASRVVLVADHTKFGRVTLASFGPLETAHVLITDPVTPRSILAAIRRRGVQVVVTSRKGR